MKKFKLFLTILLGISVVFFSCKDPEVEHKHNFSEKWEIDEYYHWKKCSCGEIDFVAEHSFGDWQVIKAATEEAEGKQERKCTVCPYTETEVIEKLAHTHKFATDWTKDETHHWYAATCEHTTEVSGKAAHSFGEYVSNNDATTEKDGTKTRECSVCGYQDTVTDEGSKIHVHTFAEDWTKDETHHWYAATCGHTTEVSEKAEHTFGNWTTTKEATEEAEGTKERSCTVCGYTATEAIEKLAHTHKFATDWTKDETNHWHAATCEHTTEVRGKAKHSFGDWTVTKEATEEAEGTREKSCTVCGYKVTEAIAKLAHTHKFATNWTKDETHHWYAATCEHTTEVSEKAAHSFGNWTTTKAATEEAEGTKERSCTVCGYTATEAIEKLEHTHKFAESLTKDETHHWYAATCEHTSEVSEKAAHSFGEWTTTKEPTEEAEGSKERSCTVCGYTATETIEKLAHTHKFATDWSKDETYHWYAATCEHTTEVSGKAAHSFGNWTTTKEATEEAEGTKERSCSICGYTATEAIEKLAHTHKFAESWSKDETHHWHASTCGHDVTDSKVEHSFVNEVCTICEYSRITDDFVLIPAGTLQMGSNVGESDEKPVHQVTITKSFYMGKYEVTQAEYEKYCSYGEDNPSSSRGDGGNYPAYYVSWYDALVYCNKRSVAEGLTPCYSISGNTDPSKWGTVPTSSDSTWNAVVCDWNANGYRLPTEAEWEYAARAGDNTVYSLTYSGTRDVNKLGDYAWYNDNSNSTTHKVGTKLPNAYGLYDMTGNVREWCWNWQTNSYDTETEGGSDPTGTSDGAYRVFRGGDFYSTSYKCNVSFRSTYYDPDFRYYHVGFRVVRANLAHTHSFGDWTVTKGSKEHVCTVCNYKEVVDIAKNPEDFVLIPAGTFQMGSNVGYSDEKPVHEVTITKSFYMGKYEVTQAEYEGYCIYGEDNPSSKYGDGGNYPAYYVSWYDALVYCNKRSVAEGLTPCYSISGNTDPSKWGTVPTTKDSTWNAVVCDWNANGYRLPTEAEWEYAARAGDNTVDSLTYSGTSDVNKFFEYAWYYSNAYYTTHEVGTKLPNAFGLYDMSGHVSEWCWNWATSGYDIGTEGGSNPTGASSGSNRSRRGGGWNQQLTTGCAVNRRGYTSPHYRKNDGGFRVVRSAVVE